MYFFKYWGKSREWFNIKKKYIDEICYHNRLGKKYIYICITILIDAEKVFYKIQHSLIKKQANQNLNIGYLLTEISHVMVKH